MKGKANGEAFVKLPRDLLESAAWRSLSINARRIVDFLMLEHMRHGGQGNGFLLAPRRQLESFGIGSHFVSAAIEEVERAGLVDCRRGVGRRPSVYALTWLPLSDGTASTNRWRAYGAVATAKQQSLQMTAVPSVLCDETAVTKPVATAKQQSQSPISRGAKQQHPSRKASYQAKAKHGRRVGVGSPAPASRAPRPAACSSPGTPYFRRGDLDRVADCLWSEVARLASAGDMRCANAMRAAIEGWVAEWAR